MAKGDVISNLSPVTTSSAHRFQPAAGVECVIRSVGTGSGANDMLDGITTGSENSYSGPHHSGKSDVMHFINNVLHLYLYNNNGSTQNLSYTGVQIK